MKKRIILFLLILLVFPYVLAISINEVELNPEGTDTGNEWVEIYNDGSAVNLSGWYVTDKDDNNYTFPSVFVEENGFYVLEFNGSFGLTNTGDNVSLYGDNNVLRDSTGTLVDSDNPGTNETWQRVPDGIGNFTFKNMTKNFTNVETNITGKNSSAVCSFVDENATLSVQVSGFCIDEVTFQVLINETWKNFSGINTDGDKWTYVIDSSEFINFNGGQINWTVSTLDCFNHTASNGIENFTLFRKTSLSVLPVAPDGLNDWRITEPLFTLSNPDALKMFYRWDGKGPFNYTAPFGLENSPNDGNTTGGLLDLKYWSNVSCSDEELQIVDFKFDFFNPLITDLSPGENETVYSDLRPNISAFVDEVYQSNSGVDSIMMYLNGVDVTGDLNVTLDDLDAYLFYVPDFDLPEGKNNVTINVSDNSGRKSTKSWSFFVNTSILDFNLTVYSPTDGNFSSRKVMFNMTTTKNVSIMEYMDNSSSRPNWRRLCKDCDNYGYSKRKKSNFKDGFHEVIIRATDEFGNIKTEIVEMLLDSRAPRIKNIAPRRGFTNGSFEVSFSEDNPKSLNLNYMNISDDENGSKVLDISSECVFVKKKYECKTQEDLSAYDGKEIEFWFNVSDVVDNVDESRHATVEVDLTPPNITEFNFIVGSNRATFYLEVDEKNFDKVFYVDQSDSRMREVTLCSRLRDGVCEKSRSFRTGEHNLTVSAIDEAGNSASVDVGFEVV